MSELKKSVTLAAAVIAAGEDLQKVLAVANEAIAALETVETELESAEGIIDEQAAQIDLAVKSNPDYRPDVKIKTGTVRINHAIRNSSGGIVSIEQIAADPKLIAELLKSESSAVTLLSKD